MDRAHKETDKLIADMERKIKRTYQQAVKETQHKLDKYMARFKADDQLKKAEVLAGVLSEKEYQEWRISHMAIGERWEAMKNTLAKDYVNADAIARSIVNEYTASAYALNHNYATYEVEKNSLVNTSYTLYSRETVERLMRDDPTMLPPPGKRLQREIARKQAVLWNKQKLQSVMMQGILQGESIPKLAKRLAYTVGESDYNSAVRAARTMMTGAQNAGRVDAYRRAQEKGVKVKNTWVATLDGRTRHEHRILDGQTRPIDQPFEVDGYEIRYPGDPDAEPFLVYNCRCTLIGQIEGFERDVVSYRDIDPDLGDMTYDEWKHAKEGK